METLRGVAVGCGGETWSRWPRILIEAISTFAAAAGAAVAAAGHVQFERPPRSLRATHAPSDLVGNVCRVQARAVEVLSELRVEQHAQLHVRVFKNSGDG